MALKVTYLAIFLVIAVNVECAKILSIFHFPSKSHHILGSSLLKALAKRGHQVTMISPFPLKTPMKNYEDIDISDMLELKSDDSFKEIVHGQNTSFFKKMSTIMTTMDKVNERFLTHPKVKKLIDSNRKFDVVIQVYFGNDAYLALPYIFDASSIAFSTIGANTMINQITGNSAPYSYVPNVFPSLPAEMTFIQRTINTLSVIASELFYNFFMVADQERLVQKYFPQVPPVRELISNLSLILLNSHYSIESPRPYVPTMIPIGGLHVEEPKELKGDLKKFLDAAVDGVIFFSLGSNINSSELPKDKIDAILKCFSKIPMKILWKFETDDLINLPSNVKLGKWLPQRDILAHPNIKLFITHGGLLSATEAMYHGVPMVGIPFFGDQERNVDDGESKGYVVRVPFHDLSEETLTAAIKEVLNNPKYRQNIKQRSSVLRDQPLKPIDSAVFWVEYVIRHNGAHHLKTTALKLKWYQYYLLDVLSLVLGIILTIFGMFYLMLRMLFKLVKKIFVKRSPAEKPQKSKKKAKLA